MPKIVCDYDKVEAIAKEMASIADDMDKSKTTYEKASTDAAKDWEGATQIGYTNVNQTQINFSSDIVAAIQEVSSYLSAAAKSIKDTDMKYANKDI